MIKLFVTNKEPTRHDDVLCLFRHINLITANADKILQNERYYNICVKGTSICGIYIGNMDLHLGDLLILWQKEIWKQGEKYYYHVGGSPLSGMSICNYWSHKKGLDYDRNTPSFGTLFQPASRVFRGRDPLEEERVVPLDLPSRKESELSIYDLVDELSPEQKKR